MVPCTIGIALIGSTLRYDFDLMLNTGRPLSVISLDLRNRLSAFGYLDEIAPGFYRMRDVLMDSQPAPPLIARASQGPALLGFQGMLGLQFLDGFRQIRFDRDTRLLNLIR
jgi:hypothetical protein